MKQRVLEDNDDGDKTTKENDPRGLKLLYRKLKARAKPAGLGILTAFAMVRSGGGGGGGLMVFPAHASAPVMPVPQLKMEDPNDAIKREVRERTLAREKKEMNANLEKARRIEQEQGVNARKQFEQENQRAKQLRGEEKMKGLEKLKKDLLVENGIHWSTDLDGERIIFEYEYGEDLRQFPGSFQHGNARLELRKSPEAFSSKAALGREWIKLVAENLDDRGIDVVKYFDEPAHRAMAARLVQIPATEQQRYLQALKTNLEKYGSPEPPVAGQMSVKEEREKFPERFVKVESEEDKQAAKQRAREEAAKAKAEAKAAKAKAKEEAAEAKAKAKAEKQKLKQEAKAAKEAVKKEKANTAAAVVGAGTAVGASVSAVGEGVAAGADVVKAGVESLANSESVVVEEDAASIGLEGAQQATNDEFVSVANEAATDFLQSKKGGGPGLKKIAIGGAGAYFIVSTIVKFRSRMNSISEDERKKQFEMLMGPDSAVLETSDAIDTDAIDVLSNGDATESSEPTEPLQVPEPAAVSDPSPAPPSEPEEPPTPTKKKKSRFKNLFSRNTNARETDLSKLVAPDAKAPGTSELLAKLLEFGSPGRFSQVKALGGEAPMDQFDLEKAKEILLAKSAEENLGVEDGAEVFANVVNCLLIELIDLAASSLKEEAKVIYDAVQIVIDFMNHAASLYDSVAEGVALDPPVTYGGNLAKGKLEEMYGAYAVTGVFEDENSEAKVDLLRSVFSIPEKKAEGILMKQQTKMIMDMAKDPEKMSQMQEMLMPGMEGMAESLMGGGGGLGPDDQPDMETLKTMLRETKKLKDEGGLSKEQLQMMRESFKEMYGSDLDEVVRQAGKENLPPDERELYELMKAVMN